MMNVAEARRIVATMTKEQTKAAALLAVNKAKNYIVAAYTFGHKDGTEGKPLQVEKLFKMIDKDMEI